MDTYIIIAQGLCVHGSGGWAFTISPKTIYHEIEDEPPCLTNVGGAGSTTEDAMKLTAVIEALDTLSIGEISTSEVEIYLDSPDLLKGIFEDMAIWKKRDWRDPDGHLVRDAVLWKQLDRHMRNLEAFGMSFLPIDVPTKDIKDALSALEHLASKQCDLQGTNTDDMQITQDIPDTAPPATRSPAFGDQLSAALDDTTAKQDALTDVLEDYKEGLITPKGAYRRIKAIGI